MNNKSIFRKTLLAASVAMLTACGGSTTPSGTTATSSTSGVITGFGSIYMNGIEYFTDGSTTALILMVCYLLKPRWVWVMCVY